MLLYDVTGCDGGGGGGVNAVVMSPPDGEVLVVGIRGAGLAPAVISVIRGVAVAVIVTSVVPTGIGDDWRLPEVGKGTKGWGIPAPITGAPWTWGENAGTDCGVLPGVTKGAPTGYAPVAAGGAAEAGKLGLKGFMAGGPAVEFRFKDTIPDSRPASDTTKNDYFDSLLKLNFF